jgi:nucleoside-diphosphate-sugar epimerase
MSIAPQNKPIVVTGGNGFVGTAVISRLLLEGYPVRSVVRNLNYSPPQDGVQHFYVNSLNLDNDWSAPLDGASVVIHTAARVHVASEKTSGGLAEFRLANVSATINLANQAAKAGVKRFIFLSSIKVNGEQTLREELFLPNDIPNPSDSYGLSKREAEDSLRLLATKTGMEVVIIRPVLIYGPGVKGNFLSMMNFIYKGFPLPFGALNNKRSFVALDNLVDLIFTCLFQPSAANRTFLVSDGNDLSLTEFFRMCSIAMGIKPCQIFVPPLFIQIAAALIGRQQMARRLCNSLQVDISETTNLLNWTPPIGVTEALQKTAADFLRKKGK